MIDEPTAIAGAALDLLLAFDRRPGVEIYSTDPAAARRIEIANDHAPHDAIEVRYVMPESTTVQALGAASSWEDNARREAGEYGLDRAETRRGLLLAQAAARHQIDALVTAAPILATPRWRNHSRRGNVMTAEEACALLGLFLRAHNDFTIRVEGNQSTFVEFERFYRGAAIAALPTYPDWLHSVWSLWRKGHGPEPFGLLRAVEARIGRALIARDYVNVRIRHWRPDETWDEILYFFESFLLSLHGAIDALARLLHVTLGLPKGKSRAGFQHRRWRDTLVDRTSSSELRELLAPEAGFPAVVELVGVLRNFIHAEMLSEEVLLGDRGPEFMDYGKGVLVLHREPAERMKSAAARVGDGESWGMSEGVDGVIKVMPVAFLRAALHQTLAGIRATMATHVLAGAVTELATPFDADFWIPTRKYSDALVLLAGISDRCCCVAPTSSPDS